MGAIYAELHVGGHVFPVLKCTYGVHQATDRRGRVTERVRFEPPTLMMDVPRGDFLLAWAAAAALRLPAHIIFFDAAGGHAVETLTFVTGAYCVDHREEFWAGDATSGAYLLFLTLSDPDGYRMEPGGPATAAVAPAARDHGTPPVAAVLGAALGGAIAGDAVVSAPLVPGSPEHKLVRWQEYQAAGKQWGYARWSKQYDVNMRNAVAGIGREKEYQEAFGGESRILKTGFTNRQIDLLRAAEMYAGQLKTGKVSLNKQAKIDLPKDKWLIGEGYQVEYILEKGASQPFLQALDLIGATYRLGNQIP